MCLPKDDKKFYSRIAQKSDLNYIEKDKLNQREEVEPLDEQNKQ